MLKHVWECYMNGIRWHQPKWLPRLLAAPIPEPSQQASQILAIQRHIVLPAKLMVTAVVFYYLFYSKWPDISSLPGEQGPQSLREVVVETLQGFFIAYLVVNAVAATLLVIRRFPHRLVPWVVFTVGFLDGLLLAGLTVQTHEGF